MKAVADALQRRADALPEGAVLRTRLQQRAAAYGAAGARPAAAPAPTPRARPLAELLATLPPAHGGPRVAEAHRRDWGALRLAQRLAQPVAEPAAPLGPLHAQVLVPRALALLQRLSPAYLQRLVEQVDALNALLPLAPNEAAPTTAAAKRRKAGAGTSPRG